MTQSQERILFNTINKKENHFHFIRKSFYHSINLLNDIQALLVSCYLYVYSQHKGISTQIFSIKEKKEKVDIHTDVSAVREKNLYIHEVIRSSSPSSKISK